MRKPKMKLWKKLALAAGIIVIILAAALIFIGNYFVNFALVRADTGEKDVAPTSIVTAEDQAEIDRNWQDITQRRDQWLAQSRQEDAGITSADGLALRGEAFYAPESTHRWLLAIHGYNSNKESMRHIASAYGLAGWNVLTPDMRAHGESEGTYIGMGWLDRQDILLWLDYIISLDPEAEIVLHGVSMGAATVMMTAGEDLPENVKGIVEDCGYTSVWDIFADELSALYRLPSFPILNVTEQVARVRAGYGFREASALEQVKKARVPILFIHGSEDNFVHTEMVYPLYDACPTAKDLLVVEGAGHGQAYSKDPELYLETVFSFLEENCLAP